MIENLCDNAIASLLRTIPGLQVVTGMQDNDPDLELPACVVYSAVQNRHGKTAIYELLTQVSYESISGQDAVSDVDATMTLIDSALTTQPSAEVLGTLNTAGLSYIGWEEIPRTMQEVGDRRKNVRELQVYASLA